MPPTPRSFAENRRFLGILNEVLSRHAGEDVDLRAAAQALASPPAGGNLGGGGNRRGRSTGAGASDQGGAGGGGAGGWIHLSDVSFFVSSGFGPLLAFVSFCLVDWSVGCVWTGYLADGWVVLGRGGIHLIMGGLRGKLDCCFMSVLGVHPGRCCVSPRPCG